MHLPKQLRGAQVILIDGYAKLAQDRNEHTESNQSLPPYGSKSGRQAIRTIKSTILRLLATCLRVRLNTIQTLVVHLLHKTFGRIFQAGLTLAIRRQQSLVYQSSRTEQRSRFIARSIVTTISITTSAASEHRKHTTKRRIDARSRDSSSDQSVILPGHEFQSYGF